MRVRKKLSPFQRANADNMLRHTAAASWLTENMACDLFETPQAQFLRMFVNHYELFPEEGDCP
jgi:hypothetical protein